MTRSQLSLRVLGLLGAFVAAGCGGPGKLPDLGLLYNRAASYHGLDRNPIIVIPGILGSRLVDTSSGRVVWGAFAGDYASPADPEGARLTALPIGDAPLAELRDGVVSNGALDRIKIELLGLPLEAEAYAYVLKTLGVGGYRDESLGLARAVDYGNDHFTCFQFDYDWRRDNVENARRLHDFILRKRAQVQAELEKRYGVKNQDVRFDIIAHSMGGLIARYYMRYGAEDLPLDGSAPRITWAGKELVDRVILVGTPNAGSARALLQLVEGIRFSVVLPTYSAAILGTFPSIYQLLPRVRHQPVIEGEGEGRPIPESLLDVGLWERMGWGLLDPAQDKALTWLLPDVTDPAERRRLARDHVRKCLERARRFHEALDAPEGSDPAAPGLELVAGDAVLTPARLRLDRASGKVVVAAEAPGDGTVLRTSAVLDERVGAPWAPRLVSPIRWRRVTFLFTDHLGLTRDPAFTDNVLYSLLEEPR